MIKCRKNLFGKEKKTFRQNKLITKIIVIEIEGRLFPYT